MDPVAARRWASTEGSDALSERPAASDPGVQILNVLGDDELDLLPHVMDLATIEALDTVSKRAHAVVCRWWCRWRALPTGIPGCVTSLTRVDPSTTWPQHASASAAPMVAPNGGAPNGGAWLLRLGVCGLQGTPFDHALCPLTVELDSAACPGASAFTLLLSADSWLRTARLPPRFCHVNVFPSGLLGIKAISFGSGSKELLRDPERLAREGCRHIKGGSTTMALAELGPASGARYIATYEGACEGRPQSLDEMLVTPAQLVVLVQHFLAQCNVDDPAQEPPYSLLCKSVAHYVQSQRELALWYPQVEAPYAPKLVPIRKQTLTRTRTRTVTLALARILTLPAGTGAAAPPARVGERTCCHGNVLPRRIACGDGGRRHQTHRHGARG